MGQDQLGSGMLATENPLLVPPNGTENHGDVFASIFCAYGDGFVEWAGLEAGGEFIASQEPWPVDAEHPLLVGPTVFYPPFALGFRGDGSLQMQISSYATNGPLALDPYGYPYFYWSPWKLACGFFLFTDDVLNMTGTQWHRIYQSCDLEVDDLDTIYVDGVGHDILVDLYICWSYLAPVLGGLLDPLGEDFFFGTVFVYSIAWHICTIGGWMVSNGQGILYYNNSVAGCVTDFWFKRGVDLGQNVGWQFFYDKYLSSSIFYLGIHGELPLELNGHTGNADLFYRDIYTVVNPPETWDLVWGGTVNHGVYGNGNIATDPCDGIEGFTVPSLCDGTPWSVSGL